MLRISFLPLLALLCFPCVSLYVQADIVGLDLALAIDSADKGDFIPVIITLSDQVDVRQFKDRNLRVRRSKLISALKNKSANSQKKLRKLLQSEGVDGSREIWLINGISADLTAPTIRRIARLTGVASLRLDKQISISGLIADVTTPALDGANSVLMANVPAGEPEWNIELIKAPEVWQQGYTGQGIVIANMDTGVDVEHPALASRWRGGNHSWFDPTDPLWDPNDPDWISGHNYAFAPPHDPIGHGTRAMGLIVAGDETGTALGVAPGATWIAVKIFDAAGNAYNSDIHLGFQWLLDPDGDPDTDDAPDVLSNSWGFEEFPNYCIDEFELDIQALKTAGIAVVHSAGNRGQNGPYSSVSPANNASSYAIGAVDSNASVALFSSRGTSACGDGIFPEVVAPGVNVKTSDLSWGGVATTKTVSGTSFASPHVAGAMALLLSALDASPEELEAALMDSAMDLGGAGADNDYGYGLVNVAAAHRLLYCASDLTDTDGDGITDLCDSCIEVENVQQRDTDGDGYGNACDADLNQDGIVNGLDIGPFKSAFGATAPGLEPYTMSDHADFNSDGVVNGLDVGVLKSSFGSLPGPSCCAAP